MPFAQLCLTDDGSLIGTDLVDIYSNSDGFLTPFIVDLEVSQIIGTNCPYIITNLPENTTQIYIVNSDETICTYLNVLPNNICETCELTFDQYTLESIGYLSVGNIISNTCENITDYVIAWYNQNNEIYLTSGYGDQFDYQFTHPLLGNSAIPVPPGVYTPVLQQITINGVSFSTNEADIDSENTVYVDLENCLPEILVNVDPFICDGPSEGLYSNIITYNGSASNLTTIPPGQEFHLLLEEGTNFLAYKFQGYDAEDQIKITYSGTNYPNKFILHWFKVGNFSPSPSEQIVNTSLPFAIRSNSAGMTAVIPLTGFSDINYGIDKIIIEITPNQTVINTDWRLSFQCLTNFDCFPCYFSETPKIQASELSFSLLGGLFNPCPTAGYTLHAVDIDGSECTENSDSEIVKYLAGGFVDTSSLYYLDAVPVNTAFQANGVWLQSLWNIVGSDDEYLQFTDGGLSLTSSNCLWPRNAPSDPIMPPNLVSIPQVGFCRAPADNIITFSKTYNEVNNSATITMTFEDYLDFYSYHYRLSTYPAILNSVAGSDDPENWQYYSYVTMVIPYDTNPNSTCGDGTYSMGYSIHKDYQYTTAITDNNFYTFTISFTGLTNQHGPNLCCTNSCNSAVSVMNATVSGPNIDIGGTYSYTSNTANRAWNPVGAKRVEAVPATTGLSVVSYWNFLVPLSQVIPRNYDNTSVTYPEYSAITCPNILNFTTRPIFPWFYGNIRRYVHFWYYLYLTDPEEPEAYSIDWVTPNGFTTIFSYDGNNVTYCDSNYILDC